MGVVGSKLAGSLWNTFGYVNFFSKDSTVNLRGSVKMFEEYHFYGQVSDFSGENFDQMEFPSCVCGSGMSGVSGAS